jgi:hypothetical protein
VEELKYLETTTRNENYVHEEIKKLNSENACYHTVQNLPSRLLSAGDWRRLHNEELHSLRFTKYYGDQVTQNFGRPPVRPRRR